MTDTSVAQSITFEAVETLPRHIEAACMEVQRRGLATPAFERAFAKAKAGLAHGEYWTDRQHVFHIPSATTPGTVYSVDVLGHCSCPAHGPCWHLVAREIECYARSLASHEAWDYIRAQGGCQIWRTTTGYLACFDGAVITHATQPCDARAALLDYQVGLLEHGLLDTVHPTHGVPIRMVNGMHSAHFATLVDAGLSTTRDVVAERRARTAQAAVLRIVVEQAA